MTDEYLNHFVDTIKLKYNDYIIYFEEPYLLVIKDDMYLELEIKTLHVALKKDDFVNYSTEYEIINDIHKIYCRFKRQYLLDNICF